MLKSILKKLFLILFLALLGGITASFIFIADSPTSEIARADTTDNVHGWAWSDNVGWVSFNCVQSFCSGNRTISCNSDTDCAGAGTCEFDAADCSTSDYGVDYNEIDGKLSGYAWSDNVGWIYFGQSGSGFPAGGTSQWARENSGSVEGWAQITNMDPEGWLQMDHGQTSPVTISNNEFFGWAWNENDDGTGIGWVSFNCSNQSECGTSDYKVYINNEPTATVSDVTFPSLCDNPVLSDVTFSWTFSDTDSGSSQSSYSIEVYNNVPALVASTGKVESSTDQRSLTIPSIDYGQSYTWKVKIWDNYNFASDWDDGSFNTPDHKYPEVDFTWGPSAGIQGTSFSPKALEDVFFVSSVTAYGSGIPITLTEWTFTDASPSASSTPNPGPVQFQSAGDKEVTLEVTDDDDYSCDITQTISAQMSLPIWEEIKPE